MAKKLIMIVCGEPSGDLHGAHLVSALKQIQPQIEICGIGGMYLKSKGVDIFYDIKELALFGISDVLKKLPKFIQLKKLILREIKERRPALIVLIDFSGFNLRLAKAINRALPIIYYVSPQVWASRPGRIKTIKKYIDKMIVFFKFEEELYQRESIDAECIGHPLLDIVKPSMEDKEFLRCFGLVDSENIITLLPGSRKSEVEHILPIMLKACYIINQRINNAQFIIAKSAQIDWEVFNRIIKNTPLNLRIVENLTYDCLNVAKFCLVCSGTATLETAIMQKPFLIIYKTGLLNYLFYRPQLKIPYIGMVNIVAGEKIIPEFIQLKAKPKDIAQKALEIINNFHQRERLRKDLALVVSRLGQKGATIRAANTIIKFLN